MARWPAVLSVVVDVDQGVGANVPDKREKQ